MGRHDEPNEYGFAGDGTAPEPPPPGQRDEVEQAEREAVPDDDLTEGLSEALSQASGAEPERDGHPDHPTPDR
jgi:hypothetical protein